MNFLRTNPNLTSVYLHVKYTRMYGLYMPRRFYNRPHCMYSTLHCYTYNVILYLPRYVLCRYNLHFMILNISIPRIFVFNCYIREIQYKSLVYLCTNNKYSWAFMYIHNVLLLDLYFILLYFIIYFYIIYILYFIVVFEFWVDMTYFQSLLVPVNIFLWLNSIINNK